METPSKPKRYLKLVGKYLWARGLFTAVGGYMIFSVLLYAATDIDICIPCLWTTLFGYHCPGCGLTTASINIVKLDFVGAWEANPLAFLILPAGLFFVYRDVSGFLKRENAPASVAA
jgi:hypothetical protein